MSRLLFILLLSVRIFSRIDEWLNAAAVINYKPDFFYVHIFVQIH